MNKLVALTTLLALVPLCAAQERDVSLTVHPDEVIGLPLVGFGAQMNPYLYAKPNWGSGGVNEQNVQDLERKVIELRPQFVRVFVAYEWLTGKKDGVNKQGEPRMWTSFLRTLRLAQRAGATITLTTWWGEPKAPEQTAQRTVELLQKIIHDEKIGAVKFINMMNEPNGDWPGEEPWTLERYNKLYRALDADLKQAGLRDEVKIISGDLVEEHQKPWLANIAKNLANLSDGISIHAYWDYRRTNKMIRRLDETRAQAATQPSIANKPFFVTEYGAQGAGIHYGGTEPGNHENGQPIARTNVQALEIGWFMMEAVNRGYVGLVQWDMYDAWYDRLMHYGVLGDVKSGWEIRPAYSVLQMFTHTTQPGWRAVKVEGSGEKLVSCALRGKKNAMTVFVLNRNDRPREVPVKGMPEGKVRLITWNGDGSGKLKEDQGRSAGELKVFCPATSIVAVVTDAE